MPKALKIFWFLVILWCGCLRPQVVLAQPVYAVDPLVSQIKGSIHYSVIGKYEARFTAFLGTIVFDPKDLEHSLVNLKVKVASLHSKFSRLDRIVISPRLLDAKRYPWITFEGRSLARVNDHFEITADVTMHGITRRLTFPFQMQGPTKDSKGNVFLLAKGTWIIRRKDFSVIWNKVLDQGGIIVGDHVTVDWDITAVNTAKNPIAQ